MEGYEPAELRDIAPDELAACKYLGDYRPLLFERYKFIGILANSVASIHEGSAAIGNIPPIQFCVMKGLLNRIARLMLSNVTLSSQGDFGETTLIIDRCIFESAMKICWITGGDTAERTSRFLADGLKGELEFLSIVRENIKNRQGVELPLESRMMRKIANTIGASGLTESMVSSAKRLPSLADILLEIDHTRLEYVVGMRLGSHAVHGTWPSLLSHYLAKDENGGWYPRDADSETDFNQYVNVSLFVLNAIRSWAIWAIPDETDRDKFLDPCAQAEKSIWELFERAVELREATLAS
jgi:Family of unknown function (DUF5677)